METKYLKNFAIIF